jgi:microcin C transport system substrate-binding protein
MKLIYTTLFLITAALCAPGVFAGTAAAAHAIAMHGSPKYGPAFQHFDYVNPQAPKGGDARLHAIGTFDTLNAFTLKGIPAIGLSSMYDTLLVGSLDEALGEYGLLLVRGYPVILNQNMTDR